MRMSNHWSGQVVPCFGNYIVEYVILINNLLHRARSPTQMMDLLQLMAVLVGQRPEMMVCCHPTIGHKKTSNHGDVMGYIGIYPQLSGYEIEDLHPKKNVSGLEVVFWNSKTKTNWAQLLQSHVDPGFQHWKIYGSGARPSSKGIAFEYLSLGYF